MATTGFGEQLKDWRGLRGLSQLDLAIRAEVSQRHISFIETGRSQPSREMVVHLGTILEVPPREQNVLLTAAGYAPRFSETPLEELDAISEVLQFMLQAHMPYMALVVDRQWNVVAANEATMSFASKLLAGSPFAVEPPLNVMRVNFHPEGLRPHMVDWEVTAAALLRRLRRDAGTYPSDGSIQELLAEVLEYPEVAELQRQPYVGEGTDLLVPATYIIDDEPVSLFTTIAIVGDAHDLTLAELRLETFWPVDEESAKRWAKMFPA